MRKKTNLSNLGGRLSAGFALSVFTILYTANTHAAIMHAPNRAMIPIMAPPMVGVCPSNFSSA